MKSDPLLITVKVLPRFPSRFSNESNSEIDHEQAAILHPALNTLLAAEGAKREAQHAATCALQRGHFLRVWVTVDDAGRVELAEPT